MASVLLSDENACGVGVPLDGAHGVVAADLPGEDAAAGAGEQGKLSQASTMAALKIHAMGHAALSFASARPMVVMATL